VIVREGKEGKKFRGKQDGRSKINKSAFCIFIITFVIPDFTPILFPEQPQNIYK
jgi:hypothetical protein